MGQAPRNYKPRVRRDSAVPKAVRPVLARVGDPWIAPDGTKVAPMLPAEFIPRVKEDTKINPVTFRGKRRRNMSELPAASNMMNAIGALMLYSFFGVGDREVDGDRRPAYFPGAGGAGDDHCRGILFYPRVALGCPGLDDIVDATRPGCPASGTAATATAQPIDAFEAIVVAGRRTRAACIGMV